MGLTDEERSILVRLEYEKALSLLEHIFTLEEGRLYSQLQTMREKADYVCTFQTTKDEILPMLAPAKGMIDKIGSLIQYQH